MLDLMQAADAAFQNRAPTRDTGCPAPREDANCDGAIDVLDVVWFVNIVFRDAVPEFCDPCVQ
jgi:hypothetical protein